MDAKQQLFPSHKVGPCGFVALKVASSPEEFIAEAARVGRPSKLPSDRLIRFMMRHRHTSPFEFVQLVFHVSLPIFVARQWMRHRACVFNEWSARYAELPDTVWHPRVWRGQARINRQASAGTVNHEPSYWGEAVTNFDGPPLAAEEVAFREYRRRLANGVAREIARSCLPVSVYTEFYWSINLHNLLHFLSLRGDGDHAQAEIVEYATVIEGIVKSLYPITWQAWREFRQDSIVLSAREQQCLQPGRIVSFPTSSEREEAVVKFKKLGITPLAAMSVEDTTKFSKGGL